MKIPTPTKNLDRDLAEFDVWITAKLGEIRDSDRFKKEMCAVVGVIERIGKATQEFASADSLKPDTISATYVESLRSEPRFTNTSLQALASVLFLVTGRSDNNVKCQFPIYLNQKLGWSTLPKIKTTGNIQRLTEVKIPRVLKASQYMGMVASLHNRPELQQKLLAEFIRFILSDERQVSQLWAVGKSYFMLKELKKEQDLLSPLVIFQVRGSVAASGGHDPEELLRTRLDEWGLLRGVDYNINDVVVRRMDGMGKVVLEELAPEEPKDSQEGDLDENDEEPAADRSSGVEKTRAYDFVLPHQSPGWEPRIFIQSQFYAGDSGSVSHKNVDQTGKSRPAVQAIFENAKFVEYVDGAGYFASLNGDLKKLLAMATTASFTQVRSAAVRLRRELQATGFLTPLDLQHAVFIADGVPGNVSHLLEHEGYKREEVDRRLKDSLSRGFLAKQGDLLIVPDSKRATPRRYLLLDTICIHGKELRSPIESKGFILVPGYGPFYGMNLTGLAEKVATIAPSLNKDWAGGPQVILNDIEWLSEQGLVMWGR